MSCMIYFHKILLQNFFITHYLLNTIDICDLKQFYLFIILKIKKVYKYFSATHIYPTSQLSNTRYDIYMGHTSHGTC